jgi:hypothetical protein
VQGRFDFRGGTAAREDTPDADSQAFEQFRRRGRVANDERARARERIVKTRELLQHLRVQAIFIDEDDVRLPFAELIGSKVPGAHASRETKSVAVFAKIARDGLEMR